MVIHTFYLHWKPGTTEAQKQRAQAEISAFQTQIPGILETYVGVNFSPRSKSYEFGAVMKFTDRAALDAYMIHPIHQQLLSWLAPLVDAVDLDFEV
jgi:Stress responsive A/B Barrel Domain